MTFSIKEIEKKANFIKTSIIELDGFGSYRRLEQDAKNDLQKYIKATFDWDIDVNIDVFNGEVLTKDLLNKFEKFYNNHINAQQISLETLAIHLNKIGSAISQLQEGINIMNDLLYYTSKNHLLYYSDNRDYCAGPVSTWLTELNKLLSEDLQQISLTPSQTTKIQLRKF